MKNLALAIAMAVATPVAATTSLCGELGGLAAEIMTFRQDGRSMSQLMPIADNAGSAAGPIIRNIIIAAYQEPHWPTGRFRTDAIADFRNTIELTCFQGLATGRDQ